MSTNDLLIFTSVGTTFILGITAVGYFYFHRWYMEEKTNGRRQIDIHKAELIRRKRERQ